MQNMEDSSVTKKKKTFHAHDNYLEINVALGVKLMAIYRCRTSQCKLKCYNNHHFL